MNLMSELPSAMEAKRPAVVRGFHGIVNVDADRVPSTDERKTEGGAVTCASEDRYTSNARPSRDLRPPPAFPR
jgi:hypothetical protein